MRRIRAILILLAGCRPGEALPHELASQPGLERAPEVITRAAAVLFWLPSVDTLPADSVAEAVRTLRQSAWDLRNLFGQADVAVLVSTSTRLYVQADNAPRRTITLAGLDYPWGVIFVDPGYAEQIITGPVGSGELTDMATDYFDLEDSDGPTPIALQSPGVTKSQSLMDLIAFGPRVISRVDTRESRLP